MNNKSVAKYFVYSLIGLIICIAGGVVGKLTRNEQGVMQTLPYIFIGIGAGIFGHNVGTGVNVRAMKKSPQLAKQKEIEENDERNITIKNKAKAKAYDLMIVAFGVLMFAFALMGVKFEFMLALVVTYLIVVFTNVYFISKYSKQM